MASGFESSRRNRAPSVSSSNGSPSVSATRPLQINRPPSRPTTPSNGFSSSPKSSISTPRGPSRPQRSDLRPRQPSDYSTTDHASVSSPFYDRPIRDRKDSNATTSSDLSVSQRHRRDLSTSDNRQRLEPQRQDSGVSPTTPVMATVMSAFSAAGARKRAMTNGSIDIEREKERQQEKDKDRATRERIQERMPGRRTTGRTRTGDIDAVLDRIDAEWAFINDDDFNSIDLALSLFDGSNEGKSMDSFRRTKIMLSKALQGSVDRHYEAFAAALPHHSSLLNHLSLTQTQIVELRTSLQESKESLGSKRADLVQLWSRGQTLEEMMRLLDDIEHLKSIPDLLETLMSEKRLLQAAMVLTRSLKLVNKSDMQEIGAVTDLRGYLIGQESALRDILLDELHNHLYLKTYWCESRWSAYAPGQQNFPKVEFEDEPVSSASLKSPLDSPTVPFTPNAPTSRLTRFLNLLHMRPNDPPQGPSDNNFRKSDSSADGLGSKPSFSSSWSLTAMNGPQANQQVNPEADSFSYMETLLESLAVLGKLGGALDIVVQRLQTEIFSLIDATLDEVEERIEESKRSSTALISSVLERQDSAGYMIAVGESNNPLNSSLGIPNGTSIALRACSLRLAALESSTTALDQETLKDFFWTVFSKLDAVTQSMRVIYEVSNRIGSRRDFKDSSGARPGSLFPLADVWLPVQAQVRTLLEDYLIDEEQSVVGGRSSIASISDTLREGRYLRDRSKAVFKFADTDLKLAGKTLKQHEDGLAKVLKDTMPGLVQNASENDMQAMLSTLGADERMGTGQHHRLLVHPDAFHVGVLFQPTVAFFDRVADNLPAGVDNSQSANVILDEFVQKVYLPQLEDRISSLFHQAVSGLDAFQPDPFSAHICARPIARSSTQLMAMINSLCAMLRTMPIHRDSYSRLVMGVIIQFYQRCSDRFQDLVSIHSVTFASAPPLALAAQWAQKAELNTCLTELLLGAAVDEVKAWQLCRQETHLEMTFLDGDTVRAEDLVPSTRNFAALCHLYYSVAWFASELDALKSLPEDGFSPATPALRNDPTNALTPFTASFSVPPLPISSQDEALSLPLSGEMAMRFGALLKTYRQLAEVVVETIRIDVRCRVVHYLDAAFRHGNYDIDHEAREPDPYIVDLNTELNKCDDFVSSALPPAEQRFAFLGLEDLMEHLLISNARFVRTANSYGVKKILRNILALQQSVKMIRGHSEAEFDRAKGYYQLFFLSPQDMLDSIRQKQMHTFDEYKIMLNLQCGVDSTLGEAGSAQANNRAYSMYCIDLHGIELESSADNQAS
ncbi:exocyst complex component sec8 [Coniophora puteana RWD-64-598 SS2]|uniref:Exocyst complex component Sec8 n=1 Tax=Coniophora puteana (strain RWD-64-598) TaxID=741705 RepID=A0A5M3N620_CONPW|nr:exocyst complex component sec8 [Coniophora puteana RWD-64-598 SS2]EIW86882.1 exocyst complex component sec8 [Coniophora puteana RWD-64-598 SS2]